MSKKKRLTLQHKALRVIEEMMPHYCIGPAAHFDGQKCIFCEVYKMAHAASGRCNHPDYEEIIKGRYYAIGRI